jgi:hypothetical protein
MFSFTGRRPLSMRFFPPPLSQGRILGFYIQTLQRPQKLAFFFQKKTRWDGAVELTAVYGV